MSEATLSLADDNKNDPSTGDAAQDNAPNSVRAMDISGARGSTMSGGFREETETFRTTCIQLFYTIV